MSKELKFPSPYDLSAPAGAEGWQGLYPYYLRFQDNLKDVEEAKFWFCDSQHWPSPFKPFDALTVEFAVKCLGQYNTRHYLVPPANGVDYRIHNGYVYMSPVAVAPVMAQPVAEEAVQENLLAGRNPIREALKAGRDIEKLLVQKGELTGSAREIVQMAKEAHIPVQEVEHQRLNELAKNHQGMVAFASAYQYSTVEAMLAEAEEKGEEPFLILLDGITDPHNLGAIIRSAECVGAHGVIVPERRAVGLTPAAVKASAGAIEHIKVARVVNMTRVIEMLKARNIWTYALTMDGTDYEKVNFKGGVALVVGSEGEGISHLVLENCDQKVSLPMAGHLDSLNASVAAGVVMYRVLSSRRA